MSSRPKSIHGVPIVWVDQLAEAVGDPIYDKDFKKIDEMVRQGAEAREMKGELFFGGGYELYILRDGKMVKPVITHEKDVAEAIAAAVAEEREACAKMLDCRAEMATDGNCGMVEIVLQQAAQAIRARGHENP